MFGRILCILLLCGLAGCATHFENTALTAGQTNDERRTVDDSHPDRPLILVAISGGGSRAAALGWAVLRELSTFHYTTDGQSRSLIDDVGVVSSVSGGSVIAADFALYGPAGLDSFAPDFLAPDNMLTLILKTLNPFHWLKQSIEGTSRIDTVEALFDKQLFKQQTFAALNQAGKPYLILNATDMASGEVFAFTPARFDDICSDLDKEPISAGVGASSAVPLVLSPVPLQDFAATNCANSPAPPWIARELNGTYAPYINLDQFKLARYANDLRHGPHSFRTIDYIYLLDGGLADNLAIHGLLETISSPYAAHIVDDPSLPGSGKSTILDAINRGKIKKVVVIVINARADPANGIYQSGSRPGIIGMTESVISVPIDSTTASVDAQMETLLGDLNGAAAGGAGGPLFQGLQVYDIQIDFDLLRASDPVQRALRKKAQNIPTLWSISKDNLDVIEQVGPLLLHNHPCFQRLLLDMHAASSFKIDANFADTGCPQAANQTASH
jgi:NTE family protein